jgi:hypothetical protein
MTRECHVRICGGLGGKFPGATRRRSLRLDAGEAATPDSLLGDDPKPTPHLIQPGGVGGGVVHVEAGPLRQPGTDLPLRGSPRARACLWVQ